MQYLEFGIFVIVVAFASFFTVVTFAGERKTPTKAAFRLLAMALFMGLAGVIGAGYEIAFTQTSAQTIHNVQTNETWVESDTNHSLVIPGGTDSYWLAWLFSGMGFLNLILLVKEMGMLQ